MVLIIMFYIIKLKNKVSAQVRAGILAPLIETGRYVNLEKEMIGRDRQ